MSKISVVPVENKSNFAKKLLADALSGKSDYFSVVVYDDFVRIKNICTDVIINDNGSSKHLPCSNTVDIFPGQGFKVNDVMFRVV